MKTKLILAACAALFSAAAAYAAPPAGGAYNVAAGSPLACAPHTTSSGARNGYDCELHSTTATVALQDLRGRQWCNADTSMCKGAGSALLHPESPGLLAAVPPGSTMHITLKCKAAADQFAPWLCDVAWVAQAAKGGAK